jgi:hypothetical protein
MKKSINILILILIMSFSWTGCAKDETIEYPNTPPVVTLDNEVIEGVRGQDITITGSLRDDFGLKFITFTSPGINLNRTTAISNPTLGINETFEFSQAHRIPANTQGSEHFITVKCKNLTGQVTEAIVRVVIP